MRTIQEIKRQMIESYINDETVKTRYGFESGQNIDTAFSKVSVESVLFYAFAVSVWALEGLFYRHKDEVAESLSRLKPHSLRWYRNKTLEYLHGVELVSESDYYDTRAMKTEDIAKAKVVKYCAVSEDAEDSKLYIKIAGEDDTKRKELKEDQVRGLKAYLSAIKDAGVYIELVNRTADKLRLTIDIFYNPLVLDSEGRRIDGNGDNTIGEAVKYYTENLPFNGEFTLAALTDVLQKIEGVVIPQIKSAESKYGDHDYSTIEARTKPDSGYFAIDKLTIRYVSYEGSDL